MTGYTKGPRGGMSDEELKAYRKDWWRRHKDEISERRRAKYQADKLNPNPVDKKKRAHKLAVRKEWRAKNKDKINSQHREWCKKNPEKKSAENRKWYLKNKEKVIAKLRLRCRKKGQRGYKENRGQQYLDAAMNLTPSSLPLATRQEIASDIVFAMYEANAPIERIGEIYKLVKKARNIELGIGMKTASLDAEIADGFTLMDTLRDGAGWEAPTSAGRRIGARGSRT